MSVVKANIKSSLIAMTNELKTMTDQDQAIEKWADLLSDIIRNAILSADVTSSHIPVLTSPSGPVTGTITTTNTIS